MEISGFTFIKNGLTLGYPILESALSIAPLCDEVIINVGFENQDLTQDDGTYEYLKDHLKEAKFKLIKSWWDPKIQKDGLILSQQTNIALQKCQGKYCQYIQGDEVIHEDDLSLIEAGIKGLEANRKTQGLIFKYLHFYGNVDIINHSRNVYRREVRLIRNHQNIQSWKDAQGFRNHDESKITAQQIQARIFHYGWARKENVMAKKNFEFDKLYHGDQGKAEDYKYQRIYGLRRFQGAHPQVVKNWIENHKNDLDLMKLPYQFKLNDLRLSLSDAIENLTDYRMGEYKNFIEVK